MLGPVEWVLLVGVAVLLEVALFWAAAALGDAPPLGWTKRAVVPLLATLALAGVAVGAGWSLRSVPLLAPENRLLLAGVALLGLLVSWLLPGVLYAPLAPVTVPRGMLIAGVQVLLRVFLYALIAAVVMVVLAVLQIARGEPRAALAAPLAGWLP
jgi:hypothetical protein